MQTRYSSPALQELPAEFGNILPLNGVEMDIYNGLWRAIIEGKLRPGNKLKEETVCEIYGISRTVVRKVFIIMAQLGIIDLPQNKGAYIAIISREEARDVLDTIRLIMSHVVFQLASPGVQLTASDRDRIEQHLKAQADAEERGNAILARILSAEFRLLLALIHGNYILSAEFDALRTRMGLAIASYYQGYVQPKRLAFQVNLIELISNHQQTEAVSAIRALYDDAEKRMKINQNLREGDDFSSIVSQYNYLSKK